MAKFKKGNNFGFRKGQVPHNKQRKCASTIKSDSQQQSYKRLTRKMTNLVQNVQYKEEDSSNVNTAVPAKLLRPTPTVNKTDKKIHSLKEKQR